MIVNEDGIKNSLVFNEDGIRIGLLLNIPWFSYASEYIFICPIFL